MSRFIAVVMNNVLISTLLFFVPFLLPIADAHETSTPHVEVATSTINELQSLTGQLQRSIQPQPQAQSQSAPLRALGAAVKAPANAQLLIAPANQIRNI